MYNVFVEHNRALSTLTAIEVLLFESTSWREKVRITDFVSEQITCCLIVNEAVWAQHKRTGM